MYVYSASVSPPYKNKSIYLKVVAKLVVSTVFTEISHILETYTSLSKTLAILDRVQISMEM